MPVAIGLALAWTDCREYDDDVFRPVAAFLCMLFALIMQVDANFINDFFDYARGNDDTATRLGPLRACTQGWVKVDSMKKAIATTTVAACLMGLPLIYYGGFEMLLVGLLCVVFCFLYTTHLSYIGMGDVLVVVFFGLVPVCITYYIQLHTVTPLVLSASLASGLVTDCLLVVNNYRDRDNDRRDGKQTLVVMIGPTASEHLYLALGIVAWAMGAVAWAYGHPLALLLSTIYLVLHLYTWLKLRRINHGRELNTCLGETARNILVYGICMAIGLLL
ncbi:MAG: 1,4-dihydroxy-2-naphthoate octaprenyltransferase [Prevotella sp.]|nr:1,4-dihydroxy-2-naphthoate octaprenyltransferase [Prevotella sp.]